MRFFETIHQLNYGHIQVRFVRYGSLRSTVYQLRNPFGTDTDKDGMCTQPVVVMGMAHDVCFGPAGVIETEYGAEETGWALHTPYNAKFIGCEMKDGKSRGLTYAHGARLDAFDYNTNLIGT